VDIVDGAADDQVAGGFLDDGEGLAVTMQLE